MTTRLNDKKVMTKNDLIDKLEILRGLKLTEKQINALKRKSVGQLEQLIAEEETKITEGGTEEGTPEVEKSRRKTDKEAEAQLKAQILELEARIVELEGRSVSKTKSVLKEELIKKEYTKEELYTMAWKSVKMLGSALGVKTFGKGKKEIVKRILAVQVKNAKK